MFARFQKPVQSQEKLINEDMAKNLENNPLLFSSVVSHLKTPGFSLVVAPHRLHVQDALRDHNDTFAEQGFNRAANIANQGSQIAAFLKRVQPDIAPQTMTRPEIIALLRSDEATEEARKIHTTSHQIARHIPT